MNAPNDITIPVAPGISKRFANNGGGGSGGRQVMRSVGSNGEDLRSDRHLHTAPPGSKTASDSDPIMEAGERWGLGMSLRQAAVKQLAGDPALAKRVARAAELLLVDAAKVVGETT